MAKYVESACCPECQSPDYMTIHSEWTMTAGIRLVYVRHCARCEVRYVPHVPRWLSVAAILSGAIVAFVGVWAAIALPGHYLGDEIWAVRGVTGAFLLGSVTGLGFVWQGGVQLRKALVRDRKRPLAYLSEDSNWTPYSEAVRELEDSEIFYID